MAKPGSRSTSVTKADQEFLSEAEEILERMRGDLVDLAAVPVGAEADPELVNRAFRSAHSLKGLAGLFGFEPIHDLAHHLEDVLDALRLGRVAMQPPVLDVLDRAVAHFAGLLAAVGDADAMQRAAAPVAALVAEIAALRERPPDAPNEFAALDLDASLLRALTEYEEHRLRENLRRGRHVLLVEATFEIIAFEEGLAELSSAARDVGEVISTLPAPGETSEAQIRFSLLVASALAAEAAETRLGLPGVRVRQASTARANVAPEPAAELAPAPAAPEVESLKALGNTVRVDIRKLDELMNLVGEMVIQRGALGDLVEDFLGDEHVGRAAKELAKVHKSLDRKLRELQAAVLDVRMVPLRQVFDKVSRVVRRLRNELDKDVRLELRGADTELDKLIVEDLVDPLMHVVRNALDHAIESPEERAAAGKVEFGTVRIEAFQRGNHVVISIADDGRGVDTARLRSRAEAVGLVEPQETLSEKETLDLVFAPGISTRSEVTQTSGRGVGMDVVRHNLTALGGVVDITSIESRGTTISMTLPITLAIVQSLVVVAAEQRFAVPLSAVHETLLIETASIQRSEGHELFNLRGDALPLRRLRAEFQLGSEEAAEKQFVVVLGMGDARVGLVVDALEGQQDTVIKPIQGPVKSIRGIAGATELGGQEAVLVLDVSAFLSEAPRREAA